MLMILTFWSRGLSDEPCSAAGGARRDSDPRLCRARRLRARGAATGGAERDNPAPDDRLDLGGADVRGRPQLVLHPYDPPLGSVQPDPFAVDLHPRDAAARGLACPPPCRRTTSPRDARPVHRRAA